MPFSSGRSVRAPAAEAPGLVVARVPGSATGCSGRPLDSVDVVMVGTAQIVDRACKRACVREKRSLYTAALVATVEADPRVLSAARANAPSVVEFRGVSKKYDGGDLGLDKATFSVRRGEFVFLVGSTGSGKSTIMRLLIKELEPTSGTIRVAGRDLAEITRKKVPFFRRNLGVVFQDFKLLPNRTVHDNVAYALQVTGGSRKEIRA